MIRNLHSRSVLTALAAILACAGATAAADHQWRFGVGVATQNMIDGSTTTNLDDFEGYRPGDDPWNPLGLGWYFNWNWRHGLVSDSATGQTVEYMPLVGGWSPGVHPSLAQIQTRVNEAPELFPDGTTWLIGNEIIWDDERTPLQYAQDYHEFYYGLKAINPTYKVANGSVITSVYYDRPGFTGTPYELLDAVRAAYQAEFGEEWPVDVWNIHPYVWTKPSVAEELADLENQLDTFRDYMAAIDEQDKPLIITEYGLLNYHAEQWMIDYMLGSFEILLSKNHPNGMPGDEGRWVQRWAWFVNNNHVWEAGGPVQWTHCALYNGDTFDIRPLGEAYAAYLKSDPAVHPGTGILVFQDGRRFPDETLYAGTCDAHILQERSLYNTGGNDVLEAARYDGGDATEDRSIVIKFADLDTSLEAGKELQQAVLTLDYFGSRNDPGGVAKTLYIHKLLHDWSEGSKTGIDGEWAGADEVCWTKPFGATGGDNPNWNGTLDEQYADPVALDSITLGGSEDHGPVSFDVTAAAREHLADPAQNFGFVIREEEGTESTQNGTRHFHSREYAGTQTALDILARPSLTLTFVAPPPVSIQSAQSFADHGAAGEIGLSVNLTAATLPADSALVTTESRDEGITKLVIDCDGGVTLPNPPEGLVETIVGMNNGDVTANVLSVTAVADVIKINLTALPDQDTYTVTLSDSLIAGDNDFMIRALVGEADNGGTSSQVVNALDLSSVRMNFGADVTAGDHAKYDIISDGAINALDLSECRVLFTHTAP